MDMDSVVDMKLTRNEIIDLIIDEMNDTLNDKVEALEKLRKAAKKKVAEYGERWTLDFFDAKKCKVDLHEGENGIRVSAYYEIPLAKKPVDLKALEAEVDQFQEQLDQLYSERRQLNENKGKARINVIRNHLQASESGKKVLGMIENVKAQMQKRLLGSGK